MTIFNVRPPAGWKKQRLKFLMEGCQNGAWGGEAGSDAVDAVCVRVADFAWERLAVSLTQPTIRSFNAAQVRKLALRAGDILIEKSGGGEKTPVGRVVAYRESELAVTSNFVARIRPNRLVNNRFLLYLIASQYLSGFAHQYVKQNTGIQNLDDAAWFASEVWLPDLPTQKRIASFLDREVTRIDLLIHKRTKFIELLAQRSELIVSRAVSGQATSDGWSFGFPKNWKFERAKIHFREQQNRSTTGNEELLTVSHLTGVTRRSEKTVNMFLSESNEGYKLVEPGDLVINTMWAWMGAMGVSAEEGLISPSYGVYRPISRELCPQFVDLLVRSRPFIAEATRRSKGIHSSRLRLYPEPFLDMRLPIPTIDMQKKIVEEIMVQIGKVDQLTSTARSAENSLRSYRSALITAAVTGRIDVDTWAKRGQADKQLDVVQEALRA